MDVDNPSQEMESFPSLQLVISFIIWMIPPVMAALLMSLSIYPSDSTAIIILLLIVALVPVSAFVLYKIDMSRNDGYVSVWGFR